MRKFFVLLVFAVLFAAVVPAACAQTAAAPGTWERLRFLLGTWEAKTGSVGSAQAQVSGAYTFRLDVDGHAMVRMSSSEGCAAPQSFDCKHNDLLTLYREEKEQNPGAVFALYLDSEGHVIHYVVSAPDANTAVFTSERSSESAPSFRLVYHLQGKVMTGKFQLSPPGSTEFKSYLEWSGVRR